MRKLEFVKINVKRRNGILMGVVDGVKEDELIR